MNDAAPTIIKVRIVGPMTNNSYQPHDDSKSNGYMSAALKRGYYYKNIAEYTGSISAVVPSMAHLEIIET